MKKASPAERWLQRYLAADPPRANSLIVTVFGDSIAPHGGSIWLGSLIRLLESFGLSARLVRTSVFRLTREGWLAAERHGRRSRYRFTDWGQKQFERAHRKIYFHSEPPWDGQWTFVLADSGIPPARRRALARELGWEGFRRISPGTFARPGGNGDFAADLPEDVIVYSARESRRARAGSLASLVNHRWDLASISAAYRKFTTRFKPLFASLRGANALSPEDAFVVRTLVIHAFRRVLLHDPLLPAEFLPAGWPGQQARKLSSAIYRLADARAEKYLEAVLGPDEFRPAAPYFRDRFGAEKEHHKDGTDYAAAYSSCQSAVEDDIRNP